MTKEFGDEARPRTLYVKVAGVKQRNPDGTKRQKLVRKCQAGQAVRLVREPDNPFDPNAVKVCTLDGHQLGYVPAGEAQWLAEELDDGWKATVRIAEVLDEASFVFSAKGLQLVGETEPPGSA